MTERAEVTWNGGLHYTGDVRGHRVEVDKPPEKGGTDEGPMPTELYLVALASCQMMSAVTIAGKRGVEIEELRAVAEMTFDGPDADEIALTLHVDSPADADAVETVARLAGRTCTVERMTGPAVDKYVVHGGGERVPVPSADDL